MEHEMNINPNANEDLAQDFFDTDPDVAPWQCEFCGRYTDTPLIEVEDSDDDACYRGEISVCTACVEEKERRCRFIKRRT